MTLTRKAASPASFLSLLPGLLGYTPTDSVAIVPMRERRTMGAMRLDLPHDEISQAASTMIGLAARVEGVQGVFAAVYTDLGRDAHDELVAELARHADAAGLLLLDVAVIGADGWKTRSAEGTLNEIAVDPEVAALVQPTYRVPTMPEPHGPIVTLAYAVDVDALTYEEAVAVGDACATGAPVNLGVFAVMLYAPSLRDVALIAMGRLVFMRSLCRGGWNPAPATRRDQSTDRTGRL